LLEQAIGRIGNIFVPVDRYLYLERFLNELFPTILYEQKKQKKPLSAHKINQEIGKLIQTNEYTKDNCEESIIYWATKNNIMIFSPTLTDGAIGDISTFFQRKHPEFAIDIAKENYVLSNMLMQDEDASAIILGGGASKHFLLNAAIFRDGFDSCIYLSTAQGFDGSDSGGNQEEAISWAKIKPEAKRVTVNADATITFPIVMAASFFKKK